MPENDKKILSGIKVSQECLRRLKIAAIQKDVTYQEIVEKILEKSMQNKKIEIFDGI